MIVRRHAEFFPPGVDVPADHHAIRISRKYRATARRERHRADRRGVPGKQGNFSLAHAAQVMPFETTKIVLAWFRPRFFEQLLLSPSSLATLTMT